MRAQRRAARGSLAGMLMRDVGTLVAVGMVLGGAGAVLMARAMRTLLFGFGSGEYSLMLLAAIVLALVAAAGYRPARRASRLEPMNALRQE